MTPSDEDKLRMVRGLSEPLQGRIKNSLLDIAIWADAMIRDVFPDDHAELTAYKLGIVRAYLCGMVGFFIAGSVKEGCENEFLASMVEDIKKNAELTGLF